MITEYISSLFHPQATYQPWNDFWYKPPDAIGSTVSGMPAGPDAAMHVSAFFNGLRILSETMAQPPLILYELFEEGETKEKAKGQKLYKVLHDQVNEWMTSYDYRIHQTCNMVLGGNAYAKILEGRAAVDGLDPLMAGRMRVKKLVGGRLGYMYREENGQEVPYTQDEIHHIRGFPLSADGTVGLSLLTFMRESTGLSLSLGAYGSKLYKNDLKRLGDYSVPGSLTPDQRTTLRQILKSEDHLLLENGATWVDRGMTARDAEFLVNRKFEITEIARWMNMAPHLLKDLERATFSNIEHQGLEFLQITMMPYFVNWEQAILRDLIVQKNRFMAQFLVDGLVRADIKTRYDAYSAGINTGFMTRNQARQKENWNKIEGLDAPLVDQNKAIVDKRGRIVPVNKPEGNGNAPAVPDVRREEEEAHYHRLLTGNAERVMRKEAAAAGKAWERDKGNRDKLAAWAAKFYGEHAQFVAECLQIDGDKAQKFAEDRRDKFLLTINDSKTSIYDHLHITEKYGPEQLIGFLQNGKHETNREAA